MMVGQLRVCLSTNWSENAELRPKSEASTITVDLIIQVVTIPIP